MLRNNITTKEHPLGVYHPHAQLHHIKKENIGLIEVMGLAVLPARLKDEMEQLAGAIVSGIDLRSDDLLKKHADWVDEFLPKYECVTAENITDILHTEIGLVFNQVLEHAGVFKRDAAGREGFARFSLGLPDSLLGPAWPSMQQEFAVPVSYAGGISMIIAAGTILSSLQCDALTRKIGTGKVTTISVLLTAAALFGFSISDSYFALCLWAIPYGLGAGCVDASLNNYVALH